MKKLTEIRLKRGLSQTALAKLMRTSQAAVSKWELGLNKPFPNTVTRLAAVLKCKESDLV